MNKLYAGFGRVNVNPMMGIGMGGYYIPRFVDGVLDDLEINALALECGETKVLLISLDHCSLVTDTATALRKYVSEATELPMEAVYFHTTHTHTSPFIRKDSEKELEQEHYRFVCHRMVDVAKLALEDLKPAKMGWGIGEAPNVTF